MARQDRNPYEVLGLEPSATRVEIRAAYLRLAKKHHPDKNPGDKASEWIFKEVGRAYETLRGTSDTRSSRGDASRRERQEHERAEPEGRQRDKGSCEQARREQQAREEAESRRREQEERERRQAHAARQERQRREQEQEDEETLRKHWKQFWLIWMPLLLLFLIAYDDGNTDIESRILLWIFVAGLGVTAWLIQFVEKVLKK